ncbi:protein-disulfide reductase DsbD [Halomonas sp. TRM85114]|uniref:protein-disulfide reductase DsbD n=1 Tax=Halomonas jincaotanensis TaxID=2810616 RepID=UPI001BD3DD05|nr:protein-disulfide reductase DsbD [Halomonas jincaotanensis]MBS9403984.1 protein-disulfide reductase DsbD [Halomonas jincaotanensis]
MLKSARLVWLLLLMLFSLSVQAQWFSSSSQDDFLPVSEAFTPSAWHDGETLFVGFENAEGYYLYRHQFAVEAASGDVVLGDLQLPPGEAKTDEFLGDVNVFYDQVVIEVPLGGEVPPGPLALDLTFQGCADAGLCYPPETLELLAAQGSPPAVFADSSATPASSAPTPASTDGLSAKTSDRSLVSEDAHFRELMQSASVPLVLGLFFIGGLGLTFTPCVLPMVPILSSIIVGQNPTRGRAFWLSASYVAGMALTYAVVGVLMGLFGAGLNLQAHLQSAPVLITFATLFGIFALAMFGTFNMRLSPRLAGRVDDWQARAQRSGPLGLALAGSLSVLVVSPCVSAPLAGALVFISTTGDALLGGAALLALGLGMGIPLLVVGTLGTTLLPRSGAWMNGVKITFGILMLAVAIWLVERLVPAPLALVLWAALVVGSALALGALTVNQSQGWPRVRQTAGILLLAWGIALIIGAAGGSGDPLRPLASLTASQPTERRGGIEDAEVTTVTRLDGLEQALASAAESGNPSFVHFTADWCISCKQLERQVYTDPQVAERLSAFTRINVDVTDTNDTSRRLLDHYDLFGPPSLLFFDATSDELREARIQGEIQSAPFASHLDGVIDWLEEQRG